MGRRADSNDGASGAPRVLSIRRAHVATPAAAQENARMDPGPGDMVLVGGCVSPQGAA